jgi:putative chitinase
MDPRYYLRRSEVEEMNRKKFFDGIRNIPFPGKLTPTQVQGITIILDEWDKRKLTDPRFLAYILATTKWETAHTMQPIKEQGSSAYLKSKRYYPWYGRGYVQLTWKTNYEKFRDRVMKRSTVDIIANPDNAMFPGVAAFIMFEGMLNGEFTGKKLSDYFNKNSDWVNARRIINGTDRAVEIAGIAKQFYADIVEAMET